MEMRIQPDLERASGSTNGDRVDFDGPNDIYNPQNWSFAKKSLNTFLYGLTTLGSTWASAAYSPANEIVAHDFQVSNEVAVLGTSVLLLGFGFGPLVWAPLSEVYGRKWPTVAPCFISALFSFATGASKDIQSIIITRFFCGFFGAAPITCTGGVFADIWDSSQRGNAIVGYALAVAAGPVLAPIVGGAIVVCGVSWRWTEYITGIIQLLTVVLDVAFVDESYAPRLLVSKARRLRFETGEWGLHAEYEELNITFSGLLHKFGVRPWQMLFTPICGLIALYASFIYGVFYASLASFPIIFQQDRGWNPLVGSLPFLALLLGILLGSALNVLNQVVFYNRRLASQGDHKAIPEARLPPMMVGSFVFAGGLFLIGWTSHPHFHWIIPCTGAFFVGFGYYTIFQSALNYLVDTFQRWGASAIAANTFLRSILASCFPAVVIPLYGNLGTGPASSCFAGFAVLMIPIPFVFYQYGAWLRTRGRWSSNIG
ncbi:major facilitator superfamily transporter multidrug resistance [Alternaria alternata]|uniref:Major facilitator superfamily transporter multidrug resistance n=2 Tax=Alternaria alternata complex TaxID=187734 RepID=A0A177D6G6_ALTAL|nr:major facilitator superfamily transporter multidrug resistance [Alternaria alternata]OAG14712.1 major facilitator superfamily transporter multidrug resistance [Alternaria alternata]RYO45821.1 Efflux pump bik6 [Alternaria tenuissima]